LESSAEIASQIAAISLQIVEMVLRRDPIQWYHRLANDFAFLRNNMYAAMPPSAKLFWLLFFYGVSVCGCVPALNSATR